MRERAMNDERLLKLLQSDPERGVKALADEYGGLVYAVARRYLAPAGFCSQDAEACAADTISEFYLDIDKFDPARGGIRGWLCVIAKHNALDLIRKRAREAGFVPIDDAAELIADDFSVEGDFESRSARRELAEAVEALGEPDRQIIVRKYYLAQSSAEIAKALGMTVSNVDTRTHRAVIKLRKRFGGNNDG